jgi:uncharacterized membrane protein YfcA
MNYVLAGLIGLLGGLSSGMFGVGGGVVMVPAMIYFMRLTAHQAVATSLIVIVPTALIGALKHNHAGHVVWPTGLALIPTALVGGFLGAWLTQFIRGDDLKRAFGGFLILVGLRLLFFK